jgi:hypothetical protein
MARAQGRGGTNKSSSAPMPLRSLTSQHLSAAFLIRFAGSGEGAGGDIDGEGSGRVDGGADRIGG